MAGRILELDRGAGIAREGNYSSWLEQKQERLDIEAKHETRRRLTLEREIEWSGMSLRARRRRARRA